LQSRSVSRPVASPPSRTTVSPTVLRAHVGTPCRPRAELMAHAEKRKSPRRLERHPVYVLNITLPSTDVDASYEPKKGVLGYKVGRVLRCIADPLGHRLDQRVCSSRGRRVSAATRLLPPENKRSSPGSCRVTPSTSGGPVSMSAPTSGDAQPDRRVTEKEPDQDSARFTGSLIRRRHVTSPAPLLGALQALALGYGK
jgi:hypothetical protein